MGKEEGEIKGERKEEKRGERKGLRRAILLDVRIKFGKDKVEVVRPKIEKIDGIRKLDSIKINVIRARDWDEFLKIL